MKHYLLFAIAFLIGQASFAQDATIPAEAGSKEKVEETSKEDAKAAKEAAKAEKKAAKAEKKASKPEKEPKEKVPYRFMANIHGGIGLMNYFGDLRDKQGTTVHRVGNRAGFNFGLGGNITNWLEMNANVVMGSVTWNQNAALHETPSNFEADVFTAGLNLVYNFKNFIHDPTAITPFVSVGVSYSDFDVFTDLQDANGNVYYYWDDGLIRNVDQSSPATDDIRILERDFEYETPYKSSPITAVSIPVGGGFDFNANRNLALRVAAHYYFTTTDGLDGNGSPDPHAPDPKASTGNPLVDDDGFLYTSVSLIFRFDPFKKKAKKLDVPGAEPTWQTVDNDDSDGDGVSDFFDRCGGTPQGIPVDKYGCPADDDNDGIPNYKDKQLNTPPGKMVAPNGVAIVYRELYENFGSDTGSLKRSEVTEEWLFSQPENSKYTVHVGTYTNYDIPTQLKLRLSKMEGLVERKLNDSVSVFTVGLFDQFEDAEQKQNELIKSGIDDAFGVNEKSLTKVSEKLANVKPANSETGQQKANLDIEDKNILVYGVELREYRLRIQLDRLSKVIAKHGVEMKSTTGGLKVYTIGAFATKAEAETLKQQVIGLGVKNPQITAKYNNEPIDLEKASEIEQSEVGE